MTPVQSCQGCGGLFAFLPRGVCADCLDLREQRYQQVREWLLDNRGASILQACEATGIAEAIIAEFIREGRLEFMGVTPSETPAELELKERIRQDLRARAATDDGPLAPAPGAGPRPRGMRSRGA